MMTGAAQASMGPSAAHVTQPQAQAAPGNVNDLAANNPFDKYIPGNDKHEELNPFDKYIPASAPGYKYETPRLRQNPAGGWEKLNDKTKEWDELPEKPIQQIADVVGWLKDLGASSKDDMARILGSLVGGAVGSRAGVAGAVVGSGVGQAAGGAIAAKMEGAEYGPGDVAVDVGVGAAGELIGRGISNVAEKAVAKYAAQRGMAPQVKAGVEAAAAKATSRIEHAKELGVTLRPDQAMMENPAYGEGIQKILQRGGPEANRLVALQAEQIQKLQMARDGVISKLKGPYESSAKVSTSSFGETFSQVLRNHEMSIGADKALAFEIDAGRVHADLDNITASFGEQLKKRVFPTENFLNERGFVDKGLWEAYKGKYREMGVPIPQDVKALANELLFLENATKGRGLAAGSEMLNTGASELAGKATGSQTSKGLATGGARQQPGLTLQEMDLVRERIGRLANFQSSARTPIERAYGDIYYQLRQTLDGKFEEVLKVNHPERAARLGAYKEFYSSFKGDIEGFQKMIEHNPTSAAEALIDRSNPAQMQALKAVLTPEQMNYLAGGYLENLTKPMINQATGKVQVTAIETAWRKTDPAVKAMLFGEDVKRIDALMNVAKVVEARPLANYKPQTDTMLSKAIGLSHQMTSVNGATQFFSKLFQKNPAAHDYYMAKTADVFIPTGMDELSIAKKQEWAQKSAIWLSRMKPVIKGKAAQMAPEQHVPLPPQTQPEASRALGSE
jgi:hypothetical protein